MAKNKFKLSLKMPRKYDFWLHFSMLVLVLYGSLMIVSTSVGSTETDNYIVLKVAIKQTAFVIIAYVMMGVLANNFTMVRARKFSKILGICLLFACLATLAFTPVNGSRAWIRIGGITLQPAEFVKVFMFVIIAVYVEIAGRRNFDWWTIIKIPFIFYLMFAIVIVLQKDLGTLVVISMISLVSLFIPSHKNLRKLQRLGKIALTAFASACVFLMTPVGLELMDHMPSSIAHVSTRFSNAVNPFLEPYDGGHQLIQGLVSIASSNFVGKGIGQSQQKFGFLTQADNDYILAIVIEETGIFGLALVVIGYVVILQRLFHYALRTKSEGYKIILVGSAMYIFLHFFLNVGGVSGTIPLTGVPLLFISSGGSSLMSVMSALGISQAVISRIRRQGE